jgi:hypothetical protein
VFSKLSTKVLLGLVAMTLPFQAMAAGAGNTGGGCYNLEIIAVKSKSADMTSTNGHSLFVLLNGNTKIMLQEGAFNVIDRNGTDGSAAFSLPNPDPTNSGSTAYSVMARLVGKPNSTLDMRTCASDSTGTTYCSVQTLSMKRIAGTSKFTNVSQQLLYIYQDIDGDGIIDRVPLFDAALSDYYWDLDSTGKMHAQLRFCPFSTQVAAP